MGKASPIEKETKTSKQKRRSRTANNKYLRPGALAQLRYSKASSTKSCTDLGKKRIVLADSKKTDSNLVTTPKVITIQETPLVFSPEKIVSSMVPSPFTLVKQNSALKTPRTPRFQDSDSRSRLEGLPMDVLVKILCHLHHDQLRAVFHVSQKIRRAVILARQCHFNYTTPDRSRQELLSTMTPQVLDHWPFISKEEEKGFQFKDLHTPKAPRHGPRPPSRLKSTEMSQVAAALFQEASIPSAYMVPSVLSNKPLCKNRVLFYEEELCQAVAQNKLR
ncbi:unnamed protein product [Amaranthus hypochondriacus]